MIKVPKPLELLLLLFSLLYILFLFHQEACNKKLFMMTPNYVIL